MQSLSLQVASVKEVFRLQRDDELIDAESKYLPVKWGFTIFRTFETVLLAIILRF